MTDTLTPNSLAPIQEESDFNLSYYWVALKRHWLVFTLSFASALALAGLYAFTRTPVYQATGIIMLQRQNQASALTGLGGITDLAGLSSQSSPLSTQIAIFKTEPVLDETIKSLQLRDKDGEPLQPSHFLRNINITPIPDTDLMQISYRDPDPAMAAKIVDELMNSYIESGVRISRVQKTAARRFIESQLPGAERGMMRAFEAQNAFRDRYGVISLEAQTPVLVNQISTLDQRITETQAQLEGLKATQRQLQEFLGTSVLEANDLTTLAQSRGVQDSIVEIQKLETQLATLSSRYQPNHPDIQALLRQLENQNQILSQRIGQLIDVSRLDKTENATRLQRGQLDLTLLNQQVTNEIQIESVSIQLAALQARMGQLQSQANQLPALERQALRLRLDVESSRARYSALLKAFQDAQLAENQDVGNAVIVQQALPSDKPVSTSPLRILLLGGMLGLVGGLVLVFLLDSLDQSIRSEDDIRNTYNFSVVLGTIPLLQPINRTLGLGAVTQPERHTNLVVRDHPRSPASEAYRMLLANLKFSSSDRSLQVVAITSGMPGEGKSTTVANLALAMAELGLRVLIVDADMRRPSQHDVWQIPNRIGLSNVIVESAPVTEVIYAENDYLDVMTAGALPPNPVALINSERLAGLIQELKSGYDYILVDTPPLTVAVDALLLGKNADATLLVARPEMLTRPSAQKAKEAIRQSGQSILGIVVNGVKTDHRQTTYYYYEKSEASASGNTRSKKKSLLSSLGINK